MRIQRLILILPGWFLLLSSVVGFWRVKHWEHSIRVASNPGPITPEDIERDATIRRNIEQVFGMGLMGGDTERPRNAPSSRSEGGGHSNPIPDRHTLEDERLTRDLRAAGLL